MPEPKDIASAFRGAPVAMDAHRAGAYMPLSGLGDDDRGRRPKAAEPYVASRGIAVVPVRGLLTKRSHFAEWFGWATYDGVEQAMHLLAADDEVSAVVLDIDSPGGMAYGAGAAAAAIRGLGKPVLAYVDPLAASAAYHIASAASEIIMAPGSAVGSIGVAMMTSKPVQPDMMGDRWFEFTSSNADNKRPDPEGEAGQAEIARELDEIEAAFIADVAAGRGVSVDQARARFGQGGVFFGASAIEAGLADRIETRRDFFAGVTEAHGLAPQQRRARRASSARAAAARAVARV